MSTGLPESALRALATIARTGQSPALNSVHVDASGQLAVEAPAPPCTFTFQFDGVAFKAHLTGDPGSFRCKLAGMVGSIPYSAEDVDGRGTLLGLIRHAATLSSPRIGIGTQQSLWLMDERHCGEHASADAVFDVVVQMLARMRPYIHLFRRTDHRSTAY